MDVLTGGLCICQGLAVPGLGHGRISFSPQRLVIRSEAHSAELRRCAEKIHAGA